MHPPDATQHANIEERSDDTSGHGPRLSVKHAGNERLFPARNGHSLGDILDVLSKEIGCRVDELIIIREGEKEPVSAVLVLDEHYPIHRRHHVHKPGPAKITVYYQASHHEHEFNRHQTVDDIRIWAINRFGIDPAMAAEIELALHDKKEHLPLTEHVGHLAGHHHEIALDLVRDPIVNG